MSDLRVGQIWRHKARGTTYVIEETSVSLQCAFEPEFEAMFSDDYWVLYRGTLTGAKHVRFIPEFLDGRFELIRDLPE